MELPIELAEWLTSLEVLDGSEVQERDSTKVTLKPEATQQFELGLKFSTLLEKLLAKKVTSVTYSG